jgi:hypothetical protein
MHKNIFAALPTDKAVAFGVVKPLYSSLFHIWSVCSFSEEIYVGRESEVLKAGASCLARSCSQPILILRITTIADNLASRSHSRKLAA